MAKKITIDIEVNGKMQKATVSAKKLRTALDGVDSSNRKTSKSTKNVERNFKGVSQQSANSTKNFSKMAQGIGGSLVPAYATLAANIFAVTAAFNAFRRAAQVEQLESSLISLGNTAGTNLSLVADSLRDITGAAIDSEQALRTVAVGTAQGFSASQLEGLTTIAKGASISLGRELPDALDRLVRGTAKLEPEILDELGIIVRLDDATRVYAASLGKNANQLTQFERQQAFANAVLEQGTKKFGEAAAAADSNPYDKLASTFSNLLKNTFEFLNLALVPLVELLASSPVALIGVLAIFASTIVGQLTPALSELGKRTRTEFSGLAKQARLAASKVQTTFEVASKKLKKVEFAPKGFKDVEDSIRKGTANAAQLKTAEKSLNLSAKRRLTSLTALKAEEKSLRGTQKAAHQVLIREKQVELTQIKQLQSEVAKLRQLESSGVGTGSGVSGAKRTAANISSKSRIGRTEAAAFKMMQGASLGDQFKIAGAASARMAGQIGKASGAVGKLGATFKVGAAGARLFGTAMLNAIPVVGQLLFAATLLYEGLTAVFGNPFEASETTKATNEILDNLKGIQESAVEVQIAMLSAATSTESTFARLKGQAGIVQQVSKAMSDLIAIQRKLRGDSLQSEQEAVRTASREDLARFFSGDYRAARDVALKSLQAERGKIAPISESEVISRMKTIAKSALEAAAKEPIEVPIEDIISVASSAKGQLAGSGLFKEGSAALTELDTILKELNANENTFLSEADVSSYVAAIEAAIEPNQRFINSFNDFPDRLTEVNTELTTLLGKSDTKFTRLKDSTEALLGVFTTIAQTIPPEGITLFGEEGAFQKKGGKAAADLADQLKQTVAYTEAFNELKMNAGLTDSERQATALKAAMAGFTDAASRADTLTAELNANLKQNKEEQQEIAQFAGENTVLATELRRLEADSVQLKINQNSAVVTLLKNYRHVKGVNELLLQLDKEGTALATEKANIENDTLRIAEATFKEKQKEARVREKLLSVQREEFRIQQQQQATEDSGSLRKAGQNPFFDFIDQGNKKLDQQIASLEAQIKFEEETQLKINTMKKAMISAEYALLRAKLEAEAKIIETDDPTGAANLRELSTKLVAAESTALQNVTDASEAKIGSLKEKLEGLKDAKENLTDINILQQGIADSLTSNMTSAFDSLIQGTSSAKDAFANMAKAILQDIAKMIAKLLVQQAIMSAFGGSFGAGATPTPTAAPAVQGAGGFRYGGIAQGYSAGGIARGKQAGYPAILHGTEAVVPLPNGKSIPVDMKAAGQNNNVTVNVSMDGQGGAQQNTQADGTQGAKLGSAIAAAVQKELHNQKRAGGILNPMGAS